MKLISLIPTTLIWACVGTVAVEVAAGSLLWISGKLSMAKIAGVMAAAYGVDADSIQHEIDTSTVLTDSEQPTFEDIVASRSLVRLNLDLRELAVDKALTNGRYLQSQLDEKRDRYLRLRRQFDEERALFEGAATDEALLEVQSTLTSIPAKQAKDQILRMLDDDSIRRDERAMNDLVTMIKSMPLEQRKRIFAEFKSDVEQRQLGDILQKIRLGFPNVDLIRETRQQLRQFDQRHKERSGNDANSS